VKEYQIVTKLMVLTSHHFSETREKRVRIFDAVSYYYYCKKTFQKLFS